MALRFLSNGAFAVGLGFLVAHWNVQSGFAVGIAGLIIAMITAQYRISPKRFMALVLVASLGKAFPPIADAAIDASEEERVDESDDWIVNWIKTAWHQAPPQFFPSLLIVLAGVGIGTAIAIFEYQISVAGGSGMLLPFEHANVTLDTQAGIVGFTLATVISSLLLSVYSIALRRVFLAAATIGCCFGAIIGLSVGLWDRFALPYALMFVCAAIMGCLLVMWVDRQEEQSGS